MSIKCPDLFILTQWAYLNEHKVDELNKHPHKALNIVFLEQLSEIGLSHSRPDNQVFHSVPQ